MKKTLQRGFTLIELLVVIAIIGILAAVVIGSLNDARDNANDASAKTSTNNIRNAAEIYYSENGFTYGLNDATMAADGTMTNVTDSGTNAPGVCANAPIVKLMQAANAQANGTGICAANDESYGVQVTLRSGKFFCVDSSGFAGEIGATRIVADATAGNNVTTCQ
ncbi:type II secretion system protein [Candidatus Kaiserbacteria bacterium]|nr:type II secretion system protein [Candidatus Kaiserbacteria bacterium]USN92334.1 MAG: type II secretion system protein [Candidatus Nomurabacteria bacterium]